MASTKKQIGIELLTVPETAKLLRVSQDHVRLLIREGRISHIKIGSRLVRIPRDGLSDFLSAGRIEAAPRPER
jgi:excisionase family DNA binding protein